MEFYLQGVRDTALQAAETALRILALFDSDRTRIERLGRAASSALRVHDCLKTEPLLAIPVAAQRLKLAQPTVTRAVSLLSELGVLEEVTGRARGRIFAYKAYLAILSEGTEPLPR